MNHTELRDFIDTYFDDNELRDLCFDLNIDYESLPAVGKSAKARELVANFQRHARFPELEELCLKLRAGAPSLQPQPTKETPPSWNLVHPYGMPPNFTGRVDERKMLTDWLNNDNENRLFILRALGGFGKSALSWHWLTHDVDSKQWTRVLWWSFYEGDASFEHFIEETLKYLKIEVPQGQRPQVDKLLEAMKSQKILLIMDGFERALRAYSSMNAAYQGDEEPKPEDSQYDCININAQIFLQKVCSLPNMKSKVLITTRLTPRAVKTHDELLQGCFEKELKEMDKADAVAFFHAQGIQGNRTEIEAACAPYGYHPLSLRLLAGRILKDFENPADIVVAQKLKIDGDIIQQKHHVLEVSYNSLPPHEQKLLSTIVCFRSPVELKTLQSIAENKDSLDNDLHDLVQRGLLHFDEKNKKFDLHPIVRRYAYDRLTAADRTGMHERLVNYFEAIPKPTKVEKLEDLASVIELYYHTVMAGELDKACNIFDDRLDEVLYFQFGAFQIQIELLRALFPNGEDNLPQLSMEEDQAWVLNALANAYGVSGQAHPSISLSEGYIYISEKQNNKNELVIGLGSVATEQLNIGALKEAESNLRRRINLCREIGNVEREAIGYQELGRLLSYRGLWDEAIDTHKNGASLAKELENPQIICVISAYRAERAIFMKNVQGAIQQAETSKTLADISYPELGVILRDQIRSNWILGSALRLNRQLDLAEQHLSDALTDARDINMVDHEANILLDLARLRYDQKNYEEAKSLADEALLITERCGYVLQGTDVNLFLAQYALEQEQDKAKAKEYAEEAKKLATCDGPPYYYKVAYEEAERMLERLKAEG